MNILKSKIIEWLKTKNREDVVYVKEFPEIIFQTHKEINDSRVRDITTAPEKRIKSVKVSDSHEDRLLVLRAFSNNFDTTFIIKDPFDNDIELKFKDKVAIVTAYPSSVK